MDKNLSNVDSAPKIKILAGVVTYTENGISEATKKSLNNLINYAKSDEESTFTLELVHTFGMSCFAGRNAAIIKGGNPVLHPELTFDWYLSIDGDNTFTPSTIEYLLNNTNNRTAIIGAGYQWKNRPEYIVAGYWYKNNGIVHDDTLIRTTAFSPNHNGNVSVNWVGMGCTLINKKFLDTLEYPFFTVPIVNNPYIGVINHVTEDIGLCMRVDKDKWEIIVNLLARSGHK